jgi:hypothetical protein
MAENLRTAFVWDTFMQNPEPLAAMKACGFHSERRSAPAEPKTNSPKPEPVPAPEVPATPPHQAPSPQAT